MRSFARLAVIVTLALGFVSAAPAKRMCTAPTTTTSTAPSTTIAAPPDTTTMIPPPDTTVAPPDTTSTPPPDTTTTSASTDTSSPADTSSPPPPPPSTTTSAAPDPTETAPPSDPNMACNGSHELCDRSFGDVVFVGAHDSYAVERGISISSIASNQNIDVPAQLDLGVRLLQAQTHLKDNVLHVCHTSCDLYDGGSLEDYLKTIFNWLSDDAHKNEVLTLVVTNNDNVAVGTWGDIFKSSGLESLVYTPPSSSLGRSDWPKMSELIANNTRVVVLMDSNADTSVVPYILSEFDNMWENKYDETDTNWPCSIDRVHGDAAGKLGMMNHFLDKSILGILIPDRGAADDTNSVDSITKNAATCEAIGDNIKVTHVLLDWVDKGQAIDAGKKLNGL